MGYKLTEKAKEVTIELMKEIKGYKKFTRGGRDRAETQFIISPKQSMEIKSIYNVQNKNSISNIVKKQLETMSITPTDKDVENFKNVFGEKIFNLLVNIHVLQGSIIKEYGTDFFNNLEKAGSKTPRFAELNKSLQNFNNEMLKKLDNK